MSKQRQFLLDGATIKSVSPWDVDSNVGWTLMGATKDATGIDLLVKRVPWLYRAIEDRALNVSSMPWNIEKGETEIANSAEWAEQKPAVLDWLELPNKLFYQIEQSLTVAGKAYLGLEVNRSGYIKGLKYYAPSTIKEIYDTNTGILTHYERNVNNKTVICSLASEPPVFGQVQIVSIYRPDYLTEIGPGTGSPALAALTAAGVLYNYDLFVSGFFDRGAIKASVLTVESASPGEQERLQHWWDDVVAGVKNAWSAIVLRGKMNAPVVIGEGLDGVENNELTTSRRQDISTALGIPESRLWSAAANMATRKEDEAAYFRGTIIPECQLIAEALNEQVFSALHKLDGYRIEFTPEVLDIFQEDEVERTAAYNSFMDAIMKAPTYELAIEVMTMYGFEFSEALDAAIKAYFAGKEERAAVVAEQTQPAVDAPEPGESENVTQDETVTEDEQPAMPDRDREPATRAMLKNWKRKAIHALKLTGKACVPWETDLIPATQLADITASLDACETKTQIEAVFDGIKIDTAEPVQETVAPDPLAGELKRATDLLERIMAQQPEPEVKAAPIPNINVTVNMPEGKPPEIKFDMPAPLAPIVNVTNNVPEQAAPVVNVNVSPTPVMVENKNTIECEGGG